MYVCAYDFVSTQEACEVQSYLEDLAMRDVTAARDPSSTVQLVCTWLTRRRYFEKAKEVSLRICARVFESRMMSIVL